MYVCMYVCMCVCCARVCVCVCGTDASYPKKGPNRPCVPYLGSQGFLQDFESREGGPARGTVSLGRHLRWGGGS